MSYKAICTAWAILRYCSCFVQIDLTTALLNRKLVIKINTSHF